MADAAHPLPECRRLCRAAVGVARDARRDAEELEDLLQVERLADGRGQRVELRLRRARRHGGLPTARSCQRRITHADGEGRRAGALDEVTSPVTVGVDVQVDLAGVLQPRPVALGAHSVAHCSLEACPPCHGGLLHLLGELPHRELHVGAVLRPVDEDADRPPVGSLVLKVQERVLRVLGLARVDDR
eukprot:11224068-Lingulodinium_polyedra.AAC.1